jgi:hypothetical protein
MGEKGGGQGGGRRRCLHRGWLGTWVTFVVYNFILMDLFWDRTDYPGLELSYLIIMDNYHFIVQIIRSLFRMLGAICCQGRNGGGADQVLQTDCAKLLKNVNEYY